MKNNFRKPSAILSVILSVLMILSVCPIMASAQYVVEYYYPEGTQFVSEIAFTRSGYWGTTYTNGLKNRLSDAGYNPWDKDLNDGCGTNSDYIVGGWKYSTNVADAIRDVKFWVSKDSSVPHSYSFNKNGKTITYYLVGGNNEPNSSNFTNGGVVDLNGGAGGDYVYCFITRDPNAGPPITYIKVNTNNADSGYTSCVAFQSPGNRVDLNSDAGGDYIYMHWTTNATAVSTTNLQNICNVAAGMYPNETNYTAATYAPLETAYLNAKPVVETYNTYGAASITQSTITSLANSLTTAVNNAETNVYFNASNNGGTTSAKATTVKIGRYSTYNMDVSSYTATKGNWNFLGWNTNKDATYGYLNNITVGFNNTLYAIFSKDVSATFKYFNNDGSLAATSVAGTIYNTSYETNVYAPGTSNITYNGDSLTFNGWRTDNATVAAEYAVSAVPATDGINRVYRAVYSAPVTLSFDNNGIGSAAPAAITANKYYNVNDTVAEGSVSFTIPSDNLTATGYGFLGWSEDKDATTADYAPGEAITGIKENTTLYAVWSRNTYPVVFKNYDGTVLQTVNVLHGEVPAYTGETPFKEGTVATKWVFDGWDNDIVPATGEASYTATFYEATADYLVQFVNDDGTVLQESMVNYLDTPVYEGETPEKESDAQYAYDFNGWDKEIAAVEGPQVYTATYVPALNSYKVFFKNSDGTVLQEEVLKYGTVPEYYGETPTKEEDAQYYYTFKGWDKEIEAITGETVYTAEYDTTLRSYEVRFENYDGTVLQSGILYYGQTPKYRGAIPQREADAQYSYAYVGWDKALEPVTGEAVYVADYEGILNRYAVSFYTEDGKNVLESKFVYYGFLPEYTGKTPVKNATAQYSYIFEGWTPALTEVTGKADYYAVFSEHINEYTVSFVNYDGTVLQEEVLAYGSEVSYKGEQPVREKDAYIYEFAGWDKEISSVTGEATYTALYNKTATAITVKFIDEDGTVLQSGLYEQGEMPVYEGETPSKAFNNGYHYEFSGWNTPVVPVTANATYKAVYTSVAHEYTETQITAPTCTEAGTMLFTCECGFSYEVTDPAFGHSYEYVIEGEEAYKVCSVCGDRISVPMEEAEEALGTQESEVQLCKHCGKYHYKYIFPDLGWISCIISRIFTFFAELFAGKAL